MFAQSYNPLGFDHPPSPPSCDQRKRHENALRKRLIEAERRRYAELERMRRMEDQLKLDEHRRQMEMRQCQLEEEEELSRHRLDLLAERTDDRAGAVSYSSFSQCPQSPQSQFACVSKDEQEEDAFLYYQGSYPPSMIVLKPDWQDTPTRNKEEPGPRRHSDPGISTICNHQGSNSGQANHIKNTEKEKPNSSDNDDESSSPPHIIAEEDLSDDEDDDEDLDSVWICQAMTI